MESNPGHSDTSLSTRPPPPRLKNHLLVTQMRTYLQTFDIFASLFFRFWEFFSSEIGSVSEAVFWALVNGANDDDVNDTNSD